MLSSGKGIAFSGAAERSQVVDRLQDLGATEARPMFPDEADAELASLWAVDGVTAQSGEDAGQVRVEVENAGETIAPQHLPRLFDRFFRADAARCCDGRDGQAHHGLGLAIVAAIARMHAGRPLAESCQGRTRVGFTLLAQA